MYYIKATIESDGKEIIIGPYTDQAEQTLAHIRLRDAEEHGKLYDSKDVGLEDFSSDDNTIEAISETDFLRAVAESSS